MIFILLFPDKIPNRYAKAPVFGIKSSIVGEISEAQAIKDTDKNAQERSNYITVNFRHLMLSKKEKDEQA